MSFSGLLCCSRAAAGKESSESLSACSYKSNAVAATSPFVAALLVGAVGAGFDVVAWRRHKRVDTTSFRSPCRRRVHLTAC